VSQYWWASYTYVSCSRPTHHPRECIEMWTSQ